MAADKKNKNSFEEFESDPFDELNEFDEEFTSIETEKDFFDEFEQSDLETVPEYDSTSGTIIKDSEPVKQIRTKDNKIVNEKIDLLEKIDKVDVNNIEKSESKDAKKTADTSSKPRLRPKRKSNKKIDDDTQIIDNVKVDADGVPLLNQFDTEKIKESSFFPKIKVRRVSISKIIMIVVGIIIALFGVYQAMNDVVRISDHVMYGEHGSFAFGLIFLGIIIIILAFYKELMKLVGLNNITSVMDDLDDSSDDTKEKSSKK